GEGVELVHHGVDGVLELKDFAAHIDGDLAREIAARDGGGDVGDVADLGGEVRWEGRDVGGQILPGAGDSLHDGLSAQFAVRADFAGHAGDFGGEGSELVHHGVDGVLELEDFAAHIDGDLAREIAVGDGDGDIGDVADLGGEVGGHRVDRFRQVLPGAGDAGNFGLAAEFAFGTHFAGHAGYFGGEPAQLAHHAVDGFGRAQQLAFEGPPFDFQCHRLGKIAPADGADDARHLRRGLDQVRDQGVDGLDLFGPRARGSGK